MASNHEPPGPSPDPQLFGTDETLVEVPTAARLLRRSTVDVNRAVDSGAVKITMRGGKRFVCLEAVEQALAAEARDATLADVRRALGGSDR